MKTITSSLTEGLGKTEFDKTSNKLIVTDTSSRVQEISKMITALDTKGKEVLIEARIVKITLQNDFRMGVNWSAVVSNYHQLSAISDFSGLGADAARKLTLNIGSMEDDNYNAVLQMLESKGRTRVLSNPRIAVVNNEEASILVGTRQPYVTTTTTTPAAGNTTTAEAVNFIDVGVKLFVTPTIHSDGFITMKIKPEVSTSTESITTSQKNTIPIVDSSEVQTTVRVKNGSTIIIGGLIKDEQINQETSVPVLGHIPFLGAAFRNKLKSKEKTEIVIFLTPKIITGDSKLDGVSHER